MVPTAPLRDEIASRKQIEDDIIKVLRDGKVKVIGICGMGGVGKTTMAEQIMNRAREESLFDETVKTDVGPQGDLLSIQRGMARWMGTTLPEGTVQPRAQLLKCMLMGRKKVLVVMDDLWEWVDLARIGIHLESCTVILSSRDSHVLVQMDVQRIFTVNPLSEEEGWVIFKGIAGACLEDRDVSVIATKVAKQCKGLPVALVTVATALQGETRKSIWSHALTQLTSRYPTDIPTIISGVYGLIQLSYDFLEIEDAKFLWFLCASFPEDHDISLESLALYSFGLRHQISSLEEERNKSDFLVDLLKCRFLILDSDLENHFKVHGLVRDVAFYIASKEGHPILDFTSAGSLSREMNEECTMLSMLQKQVNRICSANPGSVDIEVLAKSSRGSDVLPNNILNFPRLQFLYMDGIGITSIQLSDHTFEGTQQLKVLIMKDFPVESLPRQGMRQLQTLRTLHLFRCQSLETLAAVGELSALEILVCQYCSSITDLPVEVGRLKCLKHLDISFCCRFKTIVPGIISKLIRIEELLLRGFCGWASGEKQNESNVSLTELEYLFNLKRLEIDIKNQMSAAKQLRLSSKIVKYQINVGEPFVQTGEQIQTHEKVIRICLKETASLELETWIRTYARSAETLILDGGFQNLDFLGRCFGQFRTLEIGSCDSMKEVCSMKLDGNVAMTFPKLERLRLHDLESLTDFCKGNHEINVDFPRLVNLTVENCPSLMSLIDIAKDQNHLDQPSSADRCLSTHLFCNTKVRFGNLKELLIKGCKKDISCLRCRHIPQPFFAGLETIEIVACENIKNLFSYSIARILVNLKRLKISGCHEMVHVIEDDDAENQQVIFHKLEEVSLLWLSRLKSFCKGELNLQFPLLTKVEILNCFRMIGFATGSVTTPNIKTFTVDDENMNVEEMIKYPGVWSCCWEMEMEDFQHEESLMTCFCVLLRNRCFCL